MTTFGGAVDELARDVRPAAPPARRAPRPRGAPSGRAADDEALDAGRRSVALPAARVVAAEDGALDHRLHLAVRGERQRLVERPGDRAAAAVRAHRPGRGRPQPSGVERRRSRPAATRCARSSRADLHHRHRIRVRRRARQPAVEARVELPHEQRRRRRAARTSASTSAGSAAVTSTFIASLLSDVAGDVGRRRVATCALGSSALPPAAASRSGTAAARRARPPARAPPRGRARSRRSRSAARTGPWFLANASPDLRQQLEALAGRRRGRRARRAGGRGPADGRGDRPHGGPAAAARVLDADPGLRQRRGPPRPHRRLSRAADPRRLLRRRVAGARARRPGRDRRLLARGRVVRGRRRRAALPRRDRRRGRGERAGLPRPRDRRRADVPAGPRAPRRRRARPPRRERRRARRRHVLARRRARAPRDLRPHARGRWATCRSPARAGRWRRSRGSSGRA